MLDKKTALARIETARKELDELLKKGFIVDVDILLSFANFLNYKSLNNSKDYKAKILMDICTCPFLLCDQNDLSFNVKAMLPKYLKIRYDMELNELDYLLENYLISSDEYINFKEMLKFCYFKSSEDGNNILRRGKVKHYTKYN